jgi:Tetracyclin repressor-like, C-terminal domain
MVISWPAQIKDVGTMRTQWHHVIDILPTVLDAVHVPQPFEVNGVKQHPIEGVSMTYTFDHPKTASTRRTQYFELERQLLKILDVFLDYAFEKPRLFALMFLTKREGARQYPEDFRARRSPTANVSADVIARAMETGYFRKDDVWEIVFETGALMQGLVMLYLGGRMAMPPERFRAFCHRSFGRYLNGICN